MILAADIGGTKVNLALFRQEGDHLERVDSAKFESRKYSGLEEILDEFCQKKHPKLERAGFGIAGPVKNGKCEVTNLPWVVDVESLKKRLGLESVWLINDLAAMACAIPFLPETEFDVLQEGKAEAGGRIAVLAAGTGLGEAFHVAGDVDEDGDRPQPAKHAAGTERIADTLIHAVLQRNLVIGLEGLYPTCALFQQLSSSFRRHISPDSSMKEPFSAA